MTTATAVATIARIARTTYHRYAMGCLPGHLSFLFSWWLLSRYTWTGPGALTSISARSAALSVILPAAAFCTTCSALVEIGRAHVELQSPDHLVCRLLLEKK